MGMPTVISTFAGCGGSSLGYKWAGFRELLAVDFDRYTCEIFRLNFPRVPVWQRDIRRIRAGEILAFCRIKRGDLDVLDGSPPCQGFSMAGKRQVTDSRNDLFAEFARLIRGVKPKVFVAENVPGMVQGRMRGRFIGIFKMLNSLPYNIKCRRLNAMWYGVPQARERLFFMGVRSDLKKAPVFPTHLMKRPITVREAIGKKDYFIYRGFRKKEKAKYAVSTFDKPSLTITKKASSWAKAIRADCPSPAILKSCSGYSGRKLMESGRLLSIDEVKALCSFPVDFTLKGTFEQQWGVLGNSVMPLQMKAIAETIRKRIL